VVNTQTWEVQVRLVALSQCNNDSKPVNIHGSILEILLTVTVVMPETKVTTLILTLLKYICSGM
jgi:hypothetical protein